MNVVLTTNADAAKALSEISMEIALKTSVPVTRIVSTANTVT